MTKGTVFILAAALAITPVAAMAADGYVSGYTRKDGVTVDSYRRGAPDGHDYNNKRQQGGVYQPYSSGAGTFSGGDRPTFRPAYPNQPQFNTEADRQAQKLR